MDISRWPAQRSHRLSPERNDPPRPGRRKPGPTVTCQTGYVASHVGRLPSTGVPWPCPAASKGRRSEKKSKMSRICGKGNKDTELRLTRIFRAHRITGWRRQRPVFGEPDFIFPRLRVLAASRRQFPAAEVSPGTGTAALLGSPSSSLLFLYLRPGPPLACAPAVTRRYALKTSRKRYCHTPTPLSARFPIAIIDRPSLAFFK